MCVCVCARARVYRVSKEECARLRESVPYVKVYRYNPKHLFPKLNGYGDNGQRKVGASCGSKYCNLHSWYVTWQCERPWLWNAVFTVPAWRFAQSAMLRHRWAFSCIVLVTLRTTMTRVRVFLQFNLMTLCHSQVSLMLSTDINIKETTYSCQF